MTLPIEFLPGARTDFDESVDWYSERSTVAAIGFMTAVEVALLSIRDDPSRFPFTVRSCRYCRLKKYPFRIVFSEADEKLIVVAIAHVRRRPGYWSHRLE